VDHEPAPERGEGVVDAAQVVDDLRVLRRRGLSQLALAGAAGVSARHLSFAETGRSRPSRAMLLRLGEHLDVPLRDRNALLLAAGLAPAYPHRRLDDPTMAAADAVARILAAYEPYPALVVATTGDAQLQELLDELRAYPAPRPTPPRTRRPSCRSGSPHPTAVSSRSCPRRRCSARPAT
jgi:transcriptional regulator with XRE-family HTH domain